MMKLKELRKLKVGKTRTRMMGQIKTWEGSLAWHVDAEIQMRISKVSKEDRRKKKEKKRIVDWETVGTNWISSYERTKWKGEAKGSQKNKMLKKTKRCSSSQTHLRAMRCHLPYRITQCYLPPDTSEHTLPYPQPEAGTWFTYPRGMEGWVDLGDWLHTEMVYMHRDGHPSK